VTDADVEQMRYGVESRGERLRAESVTLRKASGRESI